MPYRAGAVRSQSFIHQVLIPMYEIDGYEVLPGLSRNPLFIKS